MRNHVAFFIFKNGYDKVNLQSVGILTDCFKELRLRTPQRERKA